MAPGSERIATWGLAVLAAVGLATARQAAGQQAADDLSPYSAAELVSEVRAVRPGEPFTAGLRVTLEPEWHTYWKNPGDSGEPVSIEWELPEGFEAGPIQWPVPERISFPPLVSYGYYDEVLLPVEITPPADPVPGDTVRLEGRAYWLVCIEDCFPAEAAISLSLPVVDAAPAPVSADAEAFATARARSPVPAPDGKARAIASERFIGLRIEWPGAEAPAGRIAEDLAEAHFFAAEGAVIDHAAEQAITREGTELTIRLARSGFATGVPDTLRGVLAGARADGRAIEIAAPLDDRRGSLRASAESAETTAAIEDPDARLGIGIALAFAFLGGLLLNLMPCVFPVLSLKVLGFVEHTKGDRSGPARQGAAFAAGVVVSFWVLGGLLLALRGVGESVGWGFQLQSPLFVGAMALLFFLLALSLLGVFEIGLGLTRLGGLDSGPAEGRGAPDPNGRPPESHRSSRTARSFGSGVLATVVATPCTAPFMGVALGWALLRSPPETMLVFTALGAGMAAPYVGLSLSPGLIDRLPAPGRWMETLKQVLAFPLLATVVWLAWVFGLQTGVTGLTELLAALLLAGLAAWVEGRFGGPAASRRRRRVARLALGAIGIGAVLVLTRAALGPPGGTVDGLDGPGEAAGATWERWSPQAQTGALSTGEPLFVDFTAAWCLSCQVNERVVLNTDEVRAGFAAHHVTLMKADWTRRDPAITRALSALGRSSVPVYALYPRGGGDPVLLPSVLTKDIVLDALDVHAPIPGSRASDAP